jgi:hypothetical protein
MLVFGWDGPEWRRHGKERGHFHGLEETSWSSIAVLSLAHSYVFTSLLQWYTAAGKSKPANSDQ